MARTGNKKTKDIIMSENEKNIQLSQTCSSPGNNTPRETNYTATCLPSRKLYKLDEPDTQDTAGEPRTSS